VERASLFQILAVSAFVMGSSYTISKEKIFEPVRNALGGKDTFFGYLVSCPYCLSHWVAFMVVPLTGTWIVDVPWPWGAFAWLLRWFFSSVVVTVVAAFLRIGFFLVDEGQGLLRREIAKVEEETKVVQRVAEDPRTRASVNLGATRLSRPSTS
jgi:hypothetical protein